MIYLLTGLGYFDRITEHEDSILLSIKLMSLVVYSRKRSSILVRIQMKHHCQRLV